MPTPRSSPGPRFMTICAPPIPPANSAPAVRTSACPPGRWATPRLVISTSARAASFTRTSPAFPRPSPTASWRQIRSFATLSPRPLNPDAACISSGWSATAACTAISTTSWPCPPWRMKWACRTSSSTPSWTGATPRPPAASSTWKTWKPASPPPARASPPSLVRYYAMDRDNRWERTKLAWDAIVCGKGTVCALDPRDALTPPLWRRHHR